MITLVRLPESLARRAVHIAGQSIAVREASVAEGVDHATRAVMERAAGLLADASVLLHRAALGAQAGEDPGP